MKKFVLLVALIGFTAISVSAQNEKADIIKEKDKKENQEIIIRKKGDKDKKIIIEIKGDKVTVNGKPLSEFKDDEITVNKRNVIIRDGAGNLRYKMATDDYFEGLNLWNDMIEGSGAFLGVTTNAYKEGSDDKKPKGAEITNVNKGSAAEKAGLKIGDIITRINDKKVDDPNTLSEAVTSFKPKDEVTVYFKRDGKESSSKAILGERKESRSMAYSFSGPDGMTRSFSMPRVQSVPKVEMWNDKELSEMSPRVWTPGAGNNFELLNNFNFRQQKLGLKIQDTENGNGVKVLDVDKDSPAEIAGLKKDDIITEIGGKKVSNTDEVREQLHANIEKSTYNIKATRNGSAMSFDIKIPKKLKTANL